MSAKFRVIRWIIPFSGQTNSFPAVLILQMLSPSMNSNFFENFFGARRARNYESSKNEHIFRVLQKVAETKRLFFQKCGEWQKKIYLD